MNKTIDLNGRKISYEFKRKQVKNINLRIRCDCSVYVSANNHITEIAIEEFLRKKADFIFSAIDKYTEISKYSDGKHSYLTGESFRLLGKDLRLVVTQGKQNIISDGIHLSLSLMDINDIESKEKLVSKWYDAQCREVFNEIIGEIYSVFHKYGVTMPKLILRDMSSRWGSCQPKKSVITLNKRLIEAPRNAVEYVVMHEFTHFLHPNHSAKFYEMLSALMPDWKIRKKILENTMFFIKE